MNFINVFSLLAAATSVVSASYKDVESQERAVVGNIRGQHQQRFMQEGQELITKTEWKECIGEDAQDCARMVRQDARRHEIKNLQVRVVAPRTKNEIMDTYMKVGIAVNILGEVTGDKNDGMITYPYAWVSVEDGRTRELGPWDCGGLDAWSCCRKIRQSARDQDIHGNHVECFAHENELVPEVRTDRPVYEEENLAYYTFVYAESSQQYRKRVIPYDEVLRLRAQKNTTIAEEVAVLDSMVEEETCTAGELIQLERDLMIATDALGLGDAQNLLGDMEEIVVAACKAKHPDTENVGVIEIEESATLQQVEVRVKSTEIADIMLAVRHKMYDYAVTDMVLEDYVWIYTSHNYKVWRAPRIGGAFNGHEESLKDVPGYEDYELRYVSNITKSETGTRRLMSHY